MTYSLPIIVAAILSINEVLKRVGVPKKFIPLVSLGTGMLGAVFIVPEATIQLTLFKGVLLGLSAAGLFDITKVAKRK